MPCRLMTLCTQDHSVSLLRYYVLYFNKYIILTYIQVFGLNFSIKFFKKN